jgi:hypothetical protein
MNSPQQKSVMAKSSSAANRRIPLNVLFGLPDDGKALVSVADDGKRLDFTLTGTASIVSFVSKERFAMSTLYLHPGQQIPVKIGPGPLLNHVADADICSGALGLIEQIVSKVARPCFNAPAAIRRTTRDQVSRALEGIPGLIVPRTIRIPGCPPDEVLAAAQEAALTFPILVRVAGAHGGLEMVRIDKPDDAGRISDLKSGKRPLYVTEFHDFISPDGRYRKSRIAVVGEDIFLRHQVLGESWLLHSASRTLNTEAEEIAAFAGFDAGPGTKLRSLFREIGRRLDLDFFGVDCNLDSSGRVILFEANACMLILKNTAKSPNMWDAPIARIVKAVEDLMASPERWRDFRRFKGKT